MLPGNGAPRWEGGANRSLLVPTPESTLEGGTMQLVMHQGVVDCVQYLWQPAAKGGEWLLMGGAQY